MAEALIAGIGSPHGADRLGWAVIERLRSHALPIPAKLVSCTIPSSLTPMLLDAPRAIIIDAMLGAGPAGAVHALRATDLPSAALRLSSHGAGLVETVQLACALGMPADRLWVLALDVLHPDAQLEDAWIEALIEHVKTLLAEPAYICE
jgi:hydrogenase maturation protease